MRHTANVQYLDRDFGGALTVWDRLFGTFEPEREAPVDGTHAPPPRTRFRFTSTSTQTSRVRYTPPAAGADRGACLLRDPGEVPAAMQTPTPGAR